MSKSEEPQSLETLLQSSLYMLSVYHCFLLLLVVFVFL